MQKQTDVYLLTGSNIEPRLSFLQRAAEMISQEIGIIKKQSGVYESESWGFKADCHFLNQVLIVRSSLSPENLLRSILNIEKFLGRKRSEAAYSTRTIDIDILYYGSRIIKMEHLTIPHPRLHERKFTLEPLVEIAANLIHPVLKKSNKELLENTTDMISAIVYIEQNGI